ncbi:MAG: methyltransferase domain-containing protein [Caldithrix sp.]|nr:methyltransferase domain-containing protein [Caldithrix sp.]
MFGETFWTAHYEKQQTPWDMGYASPPLTAYVDRLADKNLYILIPGVGNGWEAEYLYHKGFSNVYIIDISPQPLRNLQRRIPDFPEERIIHQDFFEHNGQYDLILEQTFFCALHPGQRNDYVRKMRSLLNPNGRLVGVQFDFPLDLSQEGPPFGGSREEYREKFSRHFDVKVLESCYNSHLARRDRELFIICEQKN